MDSADIAAQHDFTEESLTKHRRRRTDVSETGKCLYCESAITVGCFCDKECREYYEREQKIKERTGR